MNAEVFRKLSTIFLLFSLVFSDCTQPPFTNQFDSRVDSWTIANLDWLTTYSDKLQPKSIIATYHRENEGDLLFRLDLLEIIDPLQFDVYIALYYRSGGNNQLPFPTTSNNSWDILLVFPANESPYTLDHNGKLIAELIPRILRDPENDSLVIETQKSRLMGMVSTIKYQAFIVQPDSKEILSESPMIQPSLVKPGAARLLIAFWNSLPASNPVQALRRWNGAHTGPFGQRHGLSILLEQASQNKIPITLLDLKIPQSLAALELLGKLEMVKQLENSRILNLPQTASTSPGMLENWLAISEYVTGYWNLNQSQFVFAAFIEQRPLRYLANFANLKDKNHLVIWNNRLLIPLPVDYFGNTDSGTSQITPDGLSLDQKISLLKAASEREKGSLVVLGGDLAQSPWADQSSAPRLFYYIRNYPWIEPVTQEELLQMPAAKAESWPLPGCKDFLCTPESPDLLPYTWKGEPYGIELSSDRLRQEFFRELEKYSSSQLYPHVVLALHTLSKTEKDSLRAQLLANLLPQAGYLLAALQWEKTLSTEIDCSQDLDKDGEPECILSTTNRLAIIEPEEGCLVIYARRENGNSHLIISPTSLFAPGLGDPSNWNIKKGRNADLQSIPGAFCSGEQNVPYQYQISGGNLILVNEKDTRITFELNSESLIIQLNNYHSTIQIPFLQGSFWSSNQDVIMRTMVDKDEQEWFWKTGGKNFRIKLAPVNSTAGWKSSFESKALITEPELPDRTYPPGHYLAFPFAVLSFEPLPEITLSLH